MICPTLRLLKGEESEDNEEGKGEEMMRVKR